jgi:site-specific DNA-methyltransferase (adenine-specific)
MSSQLFLGDCLDVLPTIQEKSVDLALLDPPYYRVMSGGWDRQWKTMQEYIDWLETCLVAVKRVMKDNGSVYIFGDDKNIAYVQVMADKHLTLLNNIVWYKTNNQSVKSAPNLRSWAPMTERILFYTPQLCKTGLETVKLDINNFTGLREYFRQYQEAIGLGLKQINEKLGHRRAEHAFYWNSTQWDLPTAEVYAELGNAFPVDFSRRDYEELRRDYEELRRVFHADFKTLDVISGPIVDAGDNTDHPTTKPLWLIKRLLAVSTNPGDVVLDPTMGSGTTLVACAKLGRNGIGVEIDPTYFAIAEKRIKAAESQLLLGI